MDREQLREALDREIDEWARASFEDLRSRLREVCAYERGEGESRYQVEVVLLEATAEYVNVSIAVDDGGWSAFKPVSENFLVFRDSNVERPMRRHR